MELNPPLFVVYSTMVCALFLVRIEYYTGLDMLMVVHRYLMASRFDGLLGFSLRYVTHSGHLMDDPFEVTILGMCLVTAA